MVAHTPACKKNPANQRSMSSSKSNGIIAPRFGGASLAGGDIFGMMQPFAIMNQVSNQLMKGFGSMFDMDPFGLAGMMKNKASSPQVSRGGTAGRVITHTYIQQTGLGPDGRPYKEQYFSHNYAARGNDGTTLSEKQEGYQHSGTKSQKIALEKRMNNQGRRMEKERNKAIGEERTNNYFIGMNEHEGDEFERQWMKKSEEIGFMGDFGKQLGYQNYKKQQIIDPTYQHASRPQKQHKPSQKANEANAERWGLGPESGRPTTAAPRHYHTNDDIFVPENPAPRIGRARAKDIMPTMPGRGISVGAPIALGNGNNATEPRRQNNARPVEPVPMAHYVRQAEPIAAHQGDVPQNNPVRPPLHTRAPRAGNDTHGNFKNKNPQNVMPQAG
jgi:hypothetical protein